MSQVRGITGCENRSSWTLNCKVLKKNMHHLFSQLTFVQSLQVIFSPVLIQLKGSPSFKGAFTDLLSRMTDELLTLPQRKNVKLFGVNIIEDRYFPEQIHRLFWGTWTSFFAFQAIWPLIWAHGVCCCACSGGPMGCCCGRSSLWEAHHTQESQWRSSLSCWRRDIGWTNLPTAPTNCRCLHHTSACSPSSLITASFEMYFKSHLKCVMSSSFSSLFNIAKSFSVLVLQVHDHEGVLARRAITATDLQTAGGRSWPGFINDLHWCESPCW